MNLFTAKLILKIVYANKKIVLKHKSSKNKSALVSYVLFPGQKIDFISFYRIVHNRFYVGKLLAQVLYKLGYDVYVYDYLNDKIDYSINYELFFGHNKSFSEISSKLSKDCKKILITTGCSPDFDNKILRSRQQDFNSRKGCNVQLFSEVLNVKYAENNFLTADHIFMLGNSFTKSAWYSHNSVFNYHNVYLGKKIKKDVISRKNFIFLGSNLQLRRGLDLILDVFANLKTDNKVFICGPYEKESDFIEIYRRELFHNKNIIPMGYVNIDSKKFNDIVQQCTYVIYPSCSEAESSSVLNMMAKGLLPVIPENVGFDNIDEIGIKINDFNLFNVENAVKEAINLTDKQIFEKRELLFDYLDKFSAKSFVDNLQHVIKEINN